MNPLRWLREHVSDASFAHFFAGLAMVLGFDLFTSLDSAVLLALVISCGKEAIEALWGVWEPKATWEDSGMDAGQFVFGILLGIALLAVIR